MTVHQIYQSGAIMRD